MRFPAYSYVPGRWPHPTRDPDGHSFGQQLDAPAPLDVEAWQGNPTYLEAIELFDHGYYWEAHEAWERLWVAAGRTGATGDLLNGLIKLAAAGVKLRQGFGPQAARLGISASRRFARAHAECETQSLAGLSFERLHDLAAQAQSLEPPTASVDAPVHIVFDGPLRSDATV